MARTLQAPTPTRHSPRRSSFHSLAKYAAVFAFAFAFGRQWDAILPEAEQPAVHNATHRQSGRKPPDENADAIVDAMNSYKHIRDEHLQPLDCLDLLGRYESNGIPQLATSTAELPYHKSYVRLTSTGTPFYVSTHDARVDRIRAKLFNDGEYYETAMTSSVQSILAEESQKLPGRKRPVVVDVGQNIGWFSLLSAAHGAEVFSFEPNVINMVRYCESAVLNRFITSTNFGINRVHPFLAGVSNEHGANKTMYKFEANNPGSFTFSEQVGSNKPQLEGGVLPLVTLDALALDQGWLGAGDDSAPIALLKIDVEGLELDVMHGAEKLLKSKKVKNVFMELKWTGEPMEEMCKIFIASGFQLHMVGDSKGPTELVTIRYEKAEHLASDIRSKKWGSHENAWFRLQQ